MATITLKTLARGALTGSTVTYYTVPANTRALIKSAVFYNTTGGSVTLNIQLVTDPSSDGGASRTVTNVSVATTVTYIATELVNQMLEAGGTIKASGNLINFFIAGAEITS